MVMSAYWGACRRSLDNVQTLSHQSKFVDGARRALAPVALGKAPKVL